MQFFNESPSRWRRKSSTAISFSFFLQVYVLDGVFVGANDYGFLVKAMLVAAMLGTPLLLAVQPFDLGLVRLWSCEGEQLLSLCQSNFQPMSILLVLRSVPDYEMRLSVVLVRSLLDKSVCQLLGS